MIAIGAAMPVTASAAEIGIASFNLAWAGTAADFERHAAVCSVPDVNWCDSRAKIAKGETQPSLEEQERASRCQAAIDTASGGPAQSLLVAPCNAYKLSARKFSAGGLALYDDKLDGLRETIERLIDDHGVDVIAFQEVRSVEAIQTILGGHAARFDTCVAAHTAFQTVGFAWRKTVTATPGQCSDIPSLAIKEKPTDPTSLRMLRPGLELRVTIAGKPVTFMNVHLKSACANLVTGGGFAGRELTDPDAACQVLNRQVAPLEDWIEKVESAAARFVLLGDFNRRLDQEAHRRVPHNQVRQDGTPPASPNRLGPDGNVSSRFLWQEISDGKPSLFQIALAPAVTGCTGFVGLDHILISRAVRDRQSEPLSSLKVPVVRKPRQVIQTSDHCPRVTTLVF